MKQAGARPGAVDDPSGTGVYPAVMHAWHCAETRGTSRPTPAPATIVVAMPSGDLLLVEEGGG